MIDMQTMPAFWLTCLAIFNLLVCSAVGWACICRFSVMSKASTKRPFRRGYALLFTAASASGLSPWLWSELPGPGQIGMGLAALYVIWTGMRNWRDGPPLYAQSSPVDLDEATHFHIVGGTSGGDAAHTPD